MFRTAAAAAAAGRFPFFSTRRRHRQIVAMAGTTTSLAATAYYYHYYYAATATTTSTSDPTLGLRRQGRFWRRVIPVVADYYWHFGSKSPRSIMLSNNKNETPQERKQRQEQLHEKHAPEIVQVMLDLKGLYIKLGQVLSVTALPIPEAYRQRFRTLQSDVPGYEEFEIVQTVLQQELQTNNLNEIFSYIDPIPCGAASIGQAHRAVLLHHDDSQEQQEQVIVKVQYPDASWQVPADIACVGDLLQICVWTGVVDESAATMSFDEFSRQFRSELDYTAEQQNLKETYQSSLQPDAPYQKRGVQVPRVYENLSTSKVITMSYLKGPKLEEEARRQLELLGINTSKGIGSIVREAAQEAAREGDEIDEDAVVSEAALDTKTSWKVQLGKRIGQFVGFDTALWAVRMARRILLWSTAVTASTVGIAAPILPKSWNEWSQSHVTAYQQAQRLALTKEWIDALFDVHGYQIFQQGLFNSDCHPGNILVIEEEDGSPASKLGLIDYGQCKRLTPQEQVRVAELVLTVANKESDEQIAAAFRKLGVQTKNDSTEFLAEMARLMFGSFQTEHLDHAYHKRLHSMDRIMYFPKELSMVYRTSLLLRGLAISLQVNASVSEHWKSHAQAAVERHGGGVQTGEMSQENEQLVHREAVKFLPQEKTIDTQSVAAS